MGGRITCFLVSGGRYLGFQTGMQMGTVWEGQRERKRSTGSWDWPRITRCTLGWQLDKPWAAPRGCSPWPLSEEPPLGGAHGGGERPSGRPLSGCAELVEGGDLLWSVIPFAVGIAGASGHPNRILSFRWIFPLPGAVRLGLNPGVPPSTGEPVGPLSAVMMSPCAARGWGRRHTALP